MCAGVFSITKKLCVCVCVCELTIGVKLCGLSIRSVCACVRVS